MSKTFKSYVDFSKEKEENELKELALASLDVELKPVLLPGELLIAECQGVLRFNNYAERKQGVSGAVFVTNYKISFVSIDKVDKEEKTRHRRNLLLDEDDISLNCVDSVYQVSKGRRRRLLPSTGISGRVKKVDIYCKDFRIHRFSFKFVRDKGQDKKVLQAILHHAFPSKVELMFAFEYNGENTRQRKDDEFYTTMFDHRQDWEREVERCGGDQHWRLMDANRLYDLSFKSFGRDNFPEMKNSYLPKYFVVPKSMTNDELSKARGVFVENRVPTWCHTHAPSGASLVRLAALESNVASEIKQREAEILKHIQCAHPSPEAEHVCEVDLSQECPLPKDLQVNFEKLKDLCMPGTLQKCQSTDSAWLSALEATHWLDGISSCLTTANRIVQDMTQLKKTVVLRESGSCDMSCVVSSLVQICLDPFFRSFSGFQSLIQKEFVSMGFHFQDRCGHLLNREEQSPVFLLFLDCVWQLQRQFPASFEFSETYLTSIWDCVLNGIFGTFLFNSPGHRASRTSEAYKKTDIALAEVWDLRKQFSVEYLTLFKNPLYAVKKATSGRQANVSNGDCPQVTDREAQKVYSRLLCSLFLNDLACGDSSSNILSPSTGVADVELWTLCYLRWLFPVQIVNGGAPSEYFQQCLLVEEIVRLHQEISQLTRAPQHEMKKTNSDLIFSLDTPQTTQLLDTTVLTSSFPFTTVHNSAPFLATPLRAFVHQSPVLNQKKNPGAVRSSFKSYLEDSTEEPRESAD